MDLIQSSGLLPDLRGRINIVFRPLPNVGLSPILLMKENEEIMISHERQPNSGISALPFTFIRILSENKEGICSGTGFFTLLKVMVSSYL